MAIRIPPCQQPVTATRLLHNDAEQSQGERVVHIDQVWRASDFNTSTRPSIVVDNACPSIPAACARWLPVATSNIRSRCVPDVSASST